MSAPSAAFPHDAPVLDLDAMLQVIIDNLAMVDQPHGCEPYALLTDFPERLNQLYLACVNLENIAKSRPDPSRYDHLLSALAGLKAEIKESKLFANELALARLQDHAAEILDLSPEEAKADALEKANKIVTEYDPYRSIREPVVRVHKPTDPVRLARAEQMAAAIEQHNRQEAVANIRRQSATVQRETRRTWPLYATSENVFDGRDSVPIAPVPKAPEAPEAPEVVEVPAISATQLEECKLDALLAEFCILPDPTAWELATSAASQPQASGWKLADLWQAVDSLWQAEGSLW